MRIIELRVVTTTVRYIEDDDTQRPVRDTTAVELPERPALAKAEPREMRKAVGT